MVGTFCATCTATGYHRKVLTSEVAVLRLKVRRPAQRQIKPDFGQSEVKTPIEHSRNPKRALPIFVSRTQLNFYLVRK